MNCLNTDTVSPPVTSEACYSSLVTVGEFRFSIVLERLCRTEPLFLIQEEEKGAKVMDKGGELKRS